MKLNYSRNFTFPPRSRKVRFWDNVLSPFFQILAIVAGVFGFIFASIAIAAAPILLVIWFVWYLFGDKI